MLEKRGFRINLWCFGVGYEIFEIELKYYTAPRNKLFVVDYGVGGGNGGLMFIETSNSGNKVVGSIFDGDVLYCDSDYEFDNTY